MEVEKWDQQYSTICTYGLKENLELRNGITHSVYIIVHYLEPCQEGDCIVIIYHRELSAHFTNNKPPWMKWMITTAIR